MFTSERILFSCRQHGYILFLKISRWIPVVIILASVLGIITSSRAVGVIFTIVILILFFAFEFFLWNRSRFVMTPQGLHVKVRNGIFSTFETHIRFDHIRDSAYSKNHFLHFITGAGTLFARSSAGAEGDFRATHLPEVEKIFSLVSFLCRLSATERASIESLTAAQTSAAKPGRTREQAVIENLAILRAIPGITGAQEITDEERRSLFEKEEDRNHGVYETLRRSVVLCFTHDSTFRDADAPIVLQLGGKTIFPPVSFHEIRERNVVSSSPSQKLHHLLIKKFPQAHGMDATVLVGFDLS